MGIAGLGGPGGPGGPQKSQPNKTEQLMNTLKDAAKILDTEVAGMSKQQAKGTVDDAASPQDMQDMLEMNAAQRAGELTKEQIEETKEADQKKKLDRRMAELEAMEEMIDENQVDEEDKGVVQEFFQTMSRLKNLRGRMKQLEQEEREYKRKLKEQKERDKQKEKEEKKKKKKKLFFSKQEKEEKNEKDKDNGKNK